VTADVKDFYLSLTPLPRAVLDLHVLANPAQIDVPQIYATDLATIKKEYPTYRQKHPDDLSPNPTFIELRIIAHIDPTMTWFARVMEWACRGAPPGAPASARVAVIVADRIARALPGSVLVFIYADDILVLWRTRAEARELDLNGALRAAAAGPLSIKKKTIHCVSAGFTFLGVRFGGPSDALGRHGKAGTLTRAGQ
jgi:hypothetical protein